MIPVLFELIVIVAIMLMLTVAAVVIMGSAYFLKCLFEYIRSRKGVLKDEK